MMKNYFALILFSISLFPTVKASEANEYVAKVEWNPVTKIRIEAIYKDNKLVAEQVYNNFKLSEVFVNGKRTNGQDEEAAKQYDSFIQQAAKEKKEVKFYGDMRQETIGLYIGGERMKTISQKISVDKTNELREVYVDGRSWSATDKDAVAKTEADFKRYAEKEMGHKTSCEEVTEAYVICNGNRYVLDNQSDARLKRDMKQIEKTLLLDVSDTNPNVIQK